MQVLFHKVPTDNTGHCDNQSRCLRWDTHDQSCVARQRVRGLALITDDIAEMLKNATHFYLQWTPRGLLLHNLHF